MDDKQLRARIANATDAVMSANYTEDKIKQRVTEWQDGSKDKPDTAALVTFILAENRAMTEEMLFQVLRAVKAESQ